MKKFLRKLLPTIVMLAVSATLVGTSTFAWFSMNNKVTVTGMVVKTRVSSNLMIAEDELTSTSRLPDSAFTNSINSVVKGILQPASTNDGIHFYYTTDAKADGSFKGDTFEVYSSGEAPRGTNSSSYVDRFSEVYDISSSAANTLIAGETHAVPYVDYVFQLKATNTESSVKYISIETLNLMYHGDLPDTYAHRVAFFVKDITEALPSGDVEGSSATYAMPSSANFNEVGSAGTGAGKVVSGPSTYSDAVYVDSSTPLTSVAGNSTKYYKVIVRLWLEGQDETCRNDLFMPLTEEWELGIRLALIPEGNLSKTGINTIASGALLG